MKRIWILTIFPEYFNALLNCGVVGAALRGKRAGPFSLTIIDIRQHATNKYKSVDEYPYGGGAGMVLRADILKRALSNVLQLGNYGEEFKDRLHIVYPSPRGVRWNNQQARDFSKKFKSESAQDLLFICGRYEGIDERFIQLYVDQEISIGDYVLSGGEVAVQTILDSSLRFVPGVLGNDQSKINESFADGLLEHPHYTKPVDFEGYKVPDVLLSGHHKKISEFNRQESLRITAKYRPDLSAKQKRGD